MVDIELPVKFCLGNPTPLAGIVVPLTGATSLPRPVWPVVVERATLPGCVAITRHSFRPVNVIAFGRAIKVTVTTHVAWGTHEGCIAYRAHDVYTIPKQAGLAGAMLYNVARLTLAAAKEILLVFHPVLNIAQFRSTVGAMNENPAALITAFEGAVVLFTPRELRVSNLEGFATYCASGFCGAAAPMRRATARCVLRAPSAPALQVAKMSQAALQLISITIQRLSALCASCVRFFHVSPNKHPAGPCRLVVQTNRGQRDELMSIRPTSVCLDAGILSQFLKSVKSGREAIP